MTTETTADGAAAPENSNNNSSNNSPDETQSPRDKAEAKGHPDRKVWERLAYMVFFGFVGYFTFWAIVLVAIVQFCVTLASREPSEDLLRFSRNLAEYMKQISAYLGYSSDLKPCPFSPFPREEDLQTPPTDPTQE
jgi:uncharacterized protein DUF4389